MKTTKKILMGFAIFLASLALVAVFLPFFINLNQIKPKIQNYVAKKINGKIDFDSARINFFGSIGIKFRNVSLENTSAPFSGQKVFSAENADVQFEIFPLFSHQLNGIISFDKPEVNIIKIGNTNNLSSLMKISSTDHTKKENAADDSLENSSYKLALNEFNVTNAHILFKDLTHKSSPTIIDVQDINFSMIRENNILNINRLGMKLFSGDLTSNLKIDTANPQVAYTGELALEDFSLEDIYHSFGSQTKNSSFDGTANLNLTFDGAGITKEVYSKTLNGKGSFLIKKGQLKVDTTLPIILDQIGQFLTVLPIPGFSVGLSREDVRNAGISNIKNIALDNMSGNFEIKKGVLYFNQLIPMVQGTMSINATIRLFTNGLKGMGVFTANDAFTKNLIATNRNFSYLLDKNGRFTLKFYLAGTVGNPKISVETESILNNILKRAGKSILNPIESIPNTIKDTFKNIFGQ